VKAIRIDRSRRLREQPETGHNRWHPDIPAVLEVEPGEPVQLETQDAADGQIRMGMDVADLAGLDTKVAHPLTGPVHVQGALPGDLLEVETLDIEPQPYGWTRIIPGLGFLREEIDTPFLAHWTIDGGFATSAELPGVRIPDGAFMGTAGVAPSHDQLAAWSRREAELAERGGLVAPPDVEDAVPADGAVARHGLRTLPPRENGGNMDVKQMTRGSHLYLPVNVPGALYSVGDAHYAQGDSECCITAIEMGATVTVRFRLHAGEARRRGIRWPRFSHPDFFAAPQWAAPRNLTGTVGMPVRADGTQEGEDLTLAARNALREMIALLGERGWTREQAYVICSVAVDLRISNAVDLPNVIVSALLPEDIFERPDGGPQD
jgi:formamidase